MRKTIELIKQIPSCPVAVSFAVVGASALALGGAYTAQFAYGLEPCVLCLYQRLPYMAAIVLGVIALLVRRHKKAAAFVITLCAFAFLINAGIASYHVGVEQHWWESALEGCKVPDFSGADTQSLLDSILKAPNVRCDQVAWQDPVLGLSMAVYNALFCLFLSVGCCIGAFRIPRRQA